VADCWVDSFSKNLQGSNLITIDLSANTFSAWGLIRLFKNLRETVIEKV